jgi:hypothetical protein
MHLFSFSQGFLALKPLEKWKTGKSSFSYS